MATPTPDEMQAEYDAAPAQRLMPDAEFERLHMQDTVENEPADVRAKFFATAKWHARQRMTMDSLEGIDFGGMSVDEAAAGGSPRP